MLKYLITFMFAFSFAFSVELYENVVPGIPTGNGSRLGGIYNKSDEKVCNHDKTLKELMAEEAVKSAGKWRNLSYISGILSLALSILWCLTKLSQVGGAAVVSLLFGFVSAVMSQVVATLASTLLLFGAVLVIIVIGICMRKTCILEKAGEKLTGVTDDDRK